MRARLWVKLFAGAALGLLAIVAAGADDPVFIKWLVADDPGDETVRDYWERAESGQLEAPALVDLGTMVFYRGFDDDAITFFRQALDIDPELYEAWFRIGLVEHSRGNLDKASQAYERCLKKRPGHGWCNFYLGLLEEQMGHTKSAVSHYETALKHAPELADPKINPEVMSSDLVLAAKLRDYDQRRFESNAPLRYLEPKAVRKVRRQYEPTATAVPQPPEPESTTGSQAEAKGSEPRQQPTPSSPKRPPRTIPSRPTPTPASQS